jgi:hypothetical protein
MAEALTEGALLAPQKTVCRVVPGADLVGLRGGARTRTGGTVCMAVAAEPLAVLAAYPSSPVMAAVGSIRAMSPAGVGERAAPAREAKY